MNIQQSVIIQTFRHMVPQIHELMERHFDLLVKIHPHFIEKFEGKNIKHISNQFINTLIFVVDNLEDPDSLRPFLERLGEKHKSLGLTQRDLDLFQETFLRSLAAFLKEKWTPRASDNWRATFIYITNFMRDSIGLPPGPGVQVLKMGEKDSPEALEKLTEENTELPVSEPDADSSGAVGVGAVDSEGSDLEDIQGPAPDQFSRADKSDTRIPCSDAFTPYSKEFFDGIELKLEATLDLNDDQKNRIRDIAGKLAKNLVDRYWHQTFNEALDYQLEDLEESQMQGTDNEEDGSKAA